MKKIIFTLSLLSIFGICFAQNAEKRELVTEQTLKIGARDEQTLYYAFAEGDQIVLNYTVDDDKTLHEFAVIEYPENLKFKDIDSKKTLNKRFYVVKKGIFSFKLSNNQLLVARTVHFTLERVPATEALRHFDTTVEWKTRQDTSYDYNSADWDVREVPITKKTLIKQDTQVVNLFDKSERIDGIYVMSSKNETAISFQLPKNSYSPDTKNPYKSTETVSWAYWIGVGQESGKAYNEQNKKMVGVVSSAAKLAGPYGVLAGLAIDGVSMVAGSSPLGDNVVYSVFFKDLTNKKSRIDAGNGVSASAKNTTNLQGEVSMMLLNDNLREGIDVTVRAVAVQVVRQYEDKTVVKNEYIPRNKHAVKKAIIKEVKYPMAR
ncbi:MAG: hypothetical protein RI894_1621 [Bacteroidota bacterium]|jgi:hypothetical protein